MTVFGTRLALPFDDASFDVTCSFKVLAHIPEIERALRSLKGAKLFDGYRGSPPADVDAAINVVETLSALLLQHPEIVEADLNPVRIHARGQGATVLDALFVVGNS